MNDMPRCKTCKHWTAFNDEPGWGGCNRLDSEHRDMSKLVRLNTYGWEADGSDADTREDFGCIEHEERES